MSEVTMETRKDLARRIATLNYYYTDEYLQELAKAEEEKKAAEEMKNDPTDEFRCMVMTGDWNAHVNLECMKNCVEIIHYLTNEEEVVEPWQLAGITAMLDKSNEEHSFDYSMPQAISDVLGIRFIKK